MEKNFTDKKFIPKNEDKKCAVTKKHSKNSCFTLESLIKITNAYNDKCKKSGMGKPITIIEDKKYLVRALTKALENVCSDQLCWLKQDFVKNLNDEEINKKTFKPKISQGRFEWLNTTNINEIMLQYEDLYKDYKFYGAVPINFDNLPYGIKEINFDELVAKGIKKLGFIFNLDHSWQSGSHWVAMFVNIDKLQCYFFDSCSDKPPAEVKVLMHRIISWYCKKYNISCKDIEKIYKDTLTYNQIRHQKKNSECGVYAINFLLRLLKGETFEYITQNITTDDEVNKCRPVYFRFK